MTTSAARFLNAENGGTAESKMQKDEKSKCQTVYRDYQRAEIWFSKLQLAQGRFLGTWKSLEEKSETSADYTSADNTRSDYTL